MKAAQKGLFDLLNNDAALTLFYPHRNLFASSNGNLSSPATSAGTVTYRVFAFPTGTTRPFLLLAIYIVSYTVNYIYLCVVICNIQSKL